MALLPSVRVMEPVVAVSDEPLEAYHAALVGRLVLVRFPSAQVSSRMTTAWLGIARPTMAAMTKTLRRRYFIEQKPLLYAYETYICAVLPYSVVTYYPTDTSPPDDNREERRDPPTTTYTVTCALSR